jgi:putative transport protein
VFLEHGLRYVVLAIVVAVTGIGLALLAARVIDLGYGMSAGLLAGALTSTPTLGVISEAARSPVPSLGYAGTYTFANVFLTFAGTLMMTLL